jgi:hypothetical protein
MKRIRGPGEILLRAHRFADSLRPRLGRAAPYSEASLHAIPAPPSSEEAIGAAAYLGEVLCRNLGGSWVAPDGLESEVEPFVILSMDRRRVDPFAPFLSGSATPDRADRLYRSCRDAPSHRPLDPASPLRTRWIELFIDDVDGDRAAVVAALTEFVTVRTAEVLPLLAALPASVGRFDDVREGWRLAERLARAGALVNTRDVLVD